MTSAGYHVSPERANAPRDGSYEPVRKPLPRVLIDGTGDVWVRDWQDGVDVYWQIHEGYIDARSESLPYAEIERRWGISTWLMSSKSVPS